MNDLSILYPLAKTSAEFAAYITAHSPGRGGAMLPKSLFGASTPLQDMEDTLHVVALRLDPCFAHLDAITDPASCSPQIRLVFQPLSFDQGHTLSTDDAVHGFYSLTEAEFSEALAAITELRAASSTGEDLGPLAVHPLLSKEGVDGPMGKGLAALIEKYAGRENCVRVAVLTALFPEGPVGSGPGGKTWGMDGYDVVDGKLVHTNIPTLPKDTSDSFVQMSMKPFDLAFNGSNTPKDGVPLLANFKAFEDASDGARTQAFDKAVQAENPNLNSPDTIDCASCHLARPARELVGAKFGFTADGNADAFVPDATFVSDKDFAPTTTVDPTNLNLHAFSYFGSEAAINQRVINETAAILAYVNAR
jgi:hypothetical protein